MEATPTPVADMRQVTVIPTHANSALLARLDRPDLDDNLRALLRTFYPERISIAPDTGDVTIAARLEAETDNATLNALRSLLMQAIPGAASIELELSTAAISCPDSVIPEGERKEVATILEEEFDALREAICQKIPSGRGWLDLAQGRSEDDLVVLEVADDVARPILRQRGAEKIIQDFFAARGQHVRTIIERGGPETTHELIEEMAEAAGPSTPAPMPVSSPSPAKKAPDNGGWKGQGGWQGKNSNSGEGRSMGKIVPAGKVVSIATVQTEGQQVIIEGRVFKPESREVRNNKSLMTFAITDLTDSITVKFFEKTEKMPTIKAGEHMRIRGKTEFDTFLKEMIVKPLAMQPVTPLRRSDTARDKRIELHAHSKMSGMDGLTEINEYVELAAHFKHSALALTDHGIVQGFPEFYAACKKHKIKPLLGMEGYLTKTVPEELMPGSGKPKPIPYFHIVLLAINTTGLRHLYELISLSHMDHFYKKPRIPKEVLAAKRQGLILGSACEAGELFQAILNNAPEEELEEIARFYDYLEIQPIGNNGFLIGKHPDVHGDEDLRNLNRRVFDLGRRLEIPVVATSDLHFLDPEDALYRTILQAGQKYKDADKQAPLWFHSTDEMLEEFAYLGEDAAHDVVVATPQRIAAMVDDDLAPIPLVPAMPDMEGADEDIRRMATERAISMYGDPLPEKVSTRLEYELGCIIKNGFSTLYLIARQLVLKSNEDGYLVGSRGSVGSSFVATMLGITEVNPLDPHYRCKSCQFSEFSGPQEALSGFDLIDRVCPTCQEPLIKDGHSIPFATFLGIDGDKTPDIDLNFSGEYQGFIHKYVEEIFGVDNVFRAGTISGIQEKTAHGFVKGYLEERGSSRRRPEKDRLALGITGVKRTTGQHPGGVMIVPKGRNIHEFTPVNFPANDRKSGIRTTHFSYKAIHDVLLKLDLLGHDDPTFIRMLQDMTGVDVYGIPFDDRLTMSIFSSIDALGIPRGALPELKLGTLGIPEFGTGFVRGMLTDTLPSTFAELVRISGLSHGTNVWLNNAQLVIQQRLAPLSQVISVRDDIINYLITKGMEPKESFFIMENVRKGKGLKPEMEEAMRKHGVPDWYIESCKKISYMFPKAHAAAYVMMAFRIAYFKVHHKEAFYAVFFSTKGTAFSAEIVLKGLENVQITIKNLQMKEERTQKEDDLITVLEVVEEAMVRGVKFRPPDLYRSEASHFTLEDGEVRCPFTAVDGLGENAARRIVEERANGEFISIEDCKKRTGLSKTVIEALKTFNCFGDIPDSDQLELF